MVEKTSAINAVAEPISVIFFGTPEFAAILLEGLLQDPAVRVVAVITQPDRPAGRGAKLTACAVKQLALKHNITVLQPEKIRKGLDNFMLELKAATSCLPSIDLGIVAAFGQILPKAVLEFPKHGCLNIHASLLPRWRGAAPIQRAIIADDKQSAVCLMRMEEGLDTGPVFAHQMVQIEDEESYQSLHDKMAFAGRELLRTKLLQITSGSLNAVPQSQQGITYANKLSNEECQINWNLSANEIDRLIRALNPIPGAFTYLGDKRVKIFRSQVKPSLKSDLASNLDSAKNVVGAINLHNRDELQVVCGQGILSIKELQLEGKRRMQVEEFVKGIDLSGYSFVRLER